jgi:hypothetical protein
MTDAHPKRECPYCNKNIMTTRLAKHFLGSCKTAFVEANKKNFLVPHGCYMACKLKNEEVIYINVGSQISCMKEKMMYASNKKDDNRKKHALAVKELLGELEERKTQEKLIENISMNTLGGVDTKKVQDNSGAFLTVISGLIHHKECTEDQNTILERQLEFAKKFLSEEVLEELEQMAIPEEDKSDCVPEALALFPRGFLKENPEIRGPDYLKKFRK